MINLVKCGLAGNHMQETFVRPLVLVIVFYIILLR